MPRCHLSIPCEVCKVDRQVRFDNRRSRRCRRCVALRHGAARGRARGAIARSPEYESWRAMVGRCMQARHQMYEYYGGRGIQVHADWLGRGGFARFLSVLGPRPEGMTLDRIDVDGHYEPGNVRWATAKEQAANKRSSIEETCESIGGVV